MAECPSKWWVDGEIDVGDGCKLGLCQAAMGSRRDGLRVRLMMCDDDERLGRYWAVKRVTIVVIQE